MSTIEKYRQIFIDTLQIDESQVNDELSIISFDRWDSVAHMQIIAALEDAFDLMLDTDDIIQFNSYPSGQEILRKYGLEV